MRKNKFQNNLMILNLSLGITSLVLKLTKLVGKPFAGETAESISSAFQKSQSNKEATLEHFFAMSPQTIFLRKLSTTLSGRSTEDHQAILWRIWT